MAAGMPDVSALGRDSDWSGVRVVVAGFGVSGYAAADNLTFLGARVTALDESEAGDRGGRADLRAGLVAPIRLGAGAGAALADGVDLVVTAPGWAPSAPLRAQALERGAPEVDVVGEGGGRAGTEP